MEFEIYYAKTPASRHLNWNITKKLENNQKTGKTTVPELTMVKEHPHVQLTPVCQSNCATAEAKMNTNSAHSCSIFQLQITGHNSTSITGMSDILSNWMDNPEYCVLLDWVIGILGYLDISNVQSMNDEEQGVKVMAWILGYLDISSMCNPWMFLQTRCSGIIYKQLLTGIKPCYRNLPSSLNVFLYSSNKCGSNLSVFSRKSYAFCTPIL